ncbi:aliphatic sulfonate ABC transporter substrate-binding protein [Paenibacillus sp. S150]|uniref:aliphatic sulfonate ABC transporter substrate-binding protein n=1 Tax=Paenibacillus sp. S150 TaxID=2749826 RepID=UPI001C57172E|nr:aliphatic sulfonate ABC transporter substrate-binding protein [Paenibacillus sp. S150]MBW4079902.1 aliphatic sulfonate ABC transporter substrate-binding protein [Paenibacillus sp. S150]
MKFFKKSSTWIILTALTLLVAGCGNNGANVADSASPTAAPAEAPAAAESAAPPESKDYGGLTVTLGIQPGPGSYSLARSKGWFEEEFGKVGVKVEWAEFQSGPPMTEAIAAGRLDFAGLGNLPVVTAQAADIGFTEIATIIDGKKNVAIIVPKDSPINTIEELKGKKVAVAKGSNAFNFLYRGLDKAGLKPSDLEIIQLQPNEAQPAFETGGVDAWATWDPSITTNILTGKARILTDGEALDVLSPSFLIARTKLAEEYPELITKFLKVYQQAHVWEEQHQDEAVKLYAEQFQLDESIIRALRERVTPVHLPVSDEIIAQQQETANFQFEQKTIRKQIDVSEVVDNQFIEQAIKEAASEPKS